jgi:hypothetical protein
VNKQDTLISNLSQDLKPVAQPPAINKLALAWFLLSAIYVMAVTQLFGPIRPGAFTQLGTEPRFLLETLVGVVAILWFSLVAIRSAIPAALSRQFAIAGIVLMALWIAQYVIGFVSPALEPSRLGKRNYCYFETMIYSVPVILSGFYIVRRLYPLSPRRTAMSIGLVSGMLPALYMQLACMYEPLHILAFHILPGLLMVGVSAAIAARWQLGRQSSDTPSS